MAWPETTDFDLEPPEGDGEWELPSWVALVRRNEAGELHHGSRGASLPETVIVRVAGGSGRARRYLCPRPRESVLLGL
jgi:hypothetical protein